MVEGLFPYFYVLMIYYNNWIGIGENTANAIEILFIISAYHYSSPYLKTTMQFLEKNILIL
jgi:hypothetical protein